MHGRDECYKAREAIDEKKKSDERVKRRDHHHEGWQRKRYKRNRPSGQKSSPKCRIAKNQIADPQKRDGKGKAQDVPRHIIVRSILPPCPAPDACPHRKKWGSVQGLRVPQKRRWRPER